MDQNGKKGIILFKYYSTCNTGLGFDYKILPITYTSSVGGLQNTPHGSAFYPPCPVKIQGFLVCRTDKIGREFLELFFSCMSLLLTSIFL